MRRSISGSVNTTRTTFRPARAFSGTSAIWGSGSGGFGGWFDEASFAVRNSVVAVRVVSFRPAPSVYVTLARR